MNQVRKLESEVDSLRSKLEQESDSLQRCQGVSFFSFWRVKLEFIAGGFFCPSPKIWELLDREAFDTRK